MTPQVDSIEASPKLANLAPTLGQMLREEAIFHPDVAIARVRRALALIAKQTREELEAVERFLEGDPVTVAMFEDRVTEWLPGLTGAFWLAERLAWIDCRAEETRAGRFSRMALANVTGEAGKEALENALAFEDELDDVAGLATRALTARLTAILLGADVIREGDFAEVEPSPKDHALERHEPLPDAAE